MPVATWPAAPADPRVVAAAAAALGPLRDAVRMVGAPYAGWRDPLAATAAEGALAGEGVEEARAGGEVSCGLSGADLAVLGEAGALVARLWALMGLAGEQQQHQQRESGPHQGQQEEQKVEQPSSVHAGSGAAEAAGKGGDGGGGGSACAAAVAAAAQSRALLLRSLGPLHGRCAEAGLLQAVCIMVAAPPCGTCSCNGEESSSKESSSSSSSDRVDKAPEEQGSAACQAGEVGGSGGENEGGTVANVGGAASSNTSNSSWDEAWELAKPALKLRQQVGWELGSRLVR